MQFSFSLWRFRWLFWRLCWSYLWHEFWCFCSGRNRFQLGCCSVGSVHTNRGRFQRWSTHWIILAPKVLIFPPNFKISFIAIVLFWPCRAHSDCCCFAKNMIRSRSMLSIRRTSDFCSRGSEDIDFIWYVDGRYPQLHKIWSLGLDNVTREIHSTERVEVDNGTVGDITTNYLAENGHRIPIIGRLYINGSVQFLSIPDFIRNSGLLFIENFKLPLCSMAGNTVISPIITGELSRGILTACGVLPGVLPSLHVRITCLGFPDS